MREIKFRAWDTERCMIYHENLMLQRYGKREDNIFNDDTHILMQYTGLKDKNGVEIYEGDIVTIRQCDKTSIGVVKFGEHETSTDYYADTAQGFYLEDKNRDTFNLIYYGDEVLGNIYENKELLNDQT